MKFTAQAVSYGLCRDVSKGHSVRVYLLFAVCAEHARSQNLDLSFARQIALCGGVTLHESSLASRRRRFSVG